MTQYLMTVHGPAVPEDEFGGYGTREVMEEAMATTEAFNQQLRTDGHWVFAGGLAAAPTAVVVDAQGDDTVVTDGPYLESKELIGGFWVIEAPDHDTALRIAAGASKACRAEVELRAFDGLG